VALAWTTARHAHVVPIPGATRPAHLEENVRSTEITLSPEEIDRLDRAFEPTKVAGDRYPEVQMRRLDL
jgi:aryl-alcohol dehydrogenase-like predicted oxidoreductase